MKHDNADLAVSKMQIHQRMLDLNKENEVLKEYYKKGQKEISDQEIAMAQMREYYEEKLTDARNDIQNKDREIARINIDMEKRKQLNELKEEEDQRAFNEEMKDLRKENGRLNSINQELERFQDQKERLFEEKDQLQTKLEEAIKLRNEESNAKEVEKMDAVEKLRKQMLYQIKKTKANLLALNDEQLAKTTRLTMLQND